MSITTTSLSRSAGLSAVVAGLLFIVIQLVHPHEDVAAVTTTAWIVVALLTMAMSALLLIGITGMYLRQVTETGLPGLVGFLLFAIHLRPHHRRHLRRGVRAASAGRPGAPVRRGLPRHLHRRCRRRRRRVPAAGQPGRGGRLPARRSAVRARAVPSSHPRALGLLAAGRRLRRHAPGSCPPPRPRPAHRLPVGLALAGLGYSLWREQAGPPAVPAPAS